MFPCRFIFRFKSGGNSNSLDQVYNVHSVPRVGDNVGFVNENGDGTKHEVKQVEHFLNRHTGTHEILVFYGELPGE